MDSKARAILDTLQTDIQKARLKWYTEHAEAIIRTLSRESFAICHRCFGQLSLKEGCLFFQALQRGYHDHPWPRTPECPHCGAIGTSTQEGQYLKRVKPIDHTVVVSTKHVLSEETRGILNFKRKIPSEVLEELDLTYSVLEGKKTWYKEALKPS